MALDIGEYITDDYYGQDHNGYDQLTGDWLTYYKVARYFIHKVRREDKYDFLHDLMLEMAKVKAKYEAKGKPLTEAGLMRVASYELTDYWHTLMRHRPTILSLNSKANGDGADGDGEAGEAGEVIEFLADDKAVDLDLKIDIERFLLGCPTRLVKIIYKRYCGIPLTNKEYNYFKYQRQKEFKKAQKVRTF